MKTWLIGTWFLAILCASAAGQELHAINNEEYDAAYKTGATEADKELKAGEATLYVFGLRRGREFLDRETGLPCSMIAGCVVDSTICGRGAGHNDRIRKFIAERGLPSNSFRRWEKDLFDLGGYYLKRSKTENPFRLTVGAPAVESLDGGYTLRLVTMSRRFRDGTVWKYSSVVISVAGVEHKEVGFYDSEAVDCFWGPRESGFLVIRCKGEHELEFEALDLKRGKALRADSYTIGSP